MTTVGCRYSVVVSAWLLRLRWLVSDGPTVGSGFVGSGSWFDGWADERHVGRQEGDSVGLGLVIEHPWCSALVLLRSL